MERRRCSGFVKEIIAVALILIAFSVQGQDYPKDYFRSPLDIPLYLAGNFGEIRPNHFHAGLDMKTQGVEGKNIYAAADGYVSRIKIGEGGYGKTLYVTHPNGYTTVYAHLQRFNGAIESFTRNAQYYKESYEIQLFPAASELRVKKGDIIAFSGNTGGSGGPHLHFEIRETESEVPVNPLLFGFDIKDNIRPILKTLGVYPLGDSSYVNGSSSAEFFMVSGANGGYRVPDNPIKVHGSIGFGLEVIDKTTGSSNRCGVYGVELFVDDKLVYSHKMEKIGFYETRYINCHVDYGESNRTSRRIQRSFLQPNNNLGIYQQVENNGVIRFDDDSIHTVRYVVEDAHGNDSELTFKIRSESTVDYKPAEKKENTMDYFRHDEYNSFKTDEVIMGMPANILYDDLAFEYYKSSPVRGAIAETHHFHNRYVPLHSHMTISIKTDSLKPELHDKALIVALTEEKGILAAEGGKWNNGYITVKTRSLGPYTVMIDNTPPAISPVNIYPGKNLKSQETIKVKITDNLSGIKSYRGTIDGKWVLMEYDYKKNLLTYWIDRDRVEEGEHTFHIEVTDERGNTATREMKFSL